MKFDSEQIRQGTKEFYEQVGDKFSETRQHWWYGFDFMKAYLKGNERILDFGCGNGRLIEFLKETGTGNLDNLSQRYTGVDISEKLIMHARTKYPDYHFENITEEFRLPFEDQSFDIIFSMAVFHHFNPEMAERALLELKRVLKPGGIIILTTWYLWNKKYLPYLWKQIKNGNFTLEGQIPFNNQTGIFWRYCYWWRKMTLTKLVRKSGFEIREIGYTLGKRKEKRNIFLVAQK